MRQRDSLPGWRPAPRAFYSAFLHHVGNARLHSFDVIFFRDAEAHPLQIAFKAFRVVRHRFRHGSRVLAVVAGDGVHDDGAIGDVLCQRAYLVERRSESHQPVPADAPVGRLEPDDAAKARRLPDAAACVRAQSARRLLPPLRPPRNRRCEPPGTRSRSHGLCVANSAEFSVDEPMANSSMLVFPTITAPAAVELFHDGGVVRRHEIFQHLRRAGRPHAFGADYILDSQRYARQRPAFTAAIAPSACCACSSASLSVTVTKARTFGSTLAMRSRYAFGQLDR